MSRVAHERLTWLTRIAVLLVLVAWPGLCVADDYVYSDDFATDMAMVDSYSHSDFFEQLPDPWPVEGFLVYESFTSSRTLSLYCGSGHDAYAWLRYGFPLEGGGAGYSSAVVELALVENWGYGTIQCGCSLEGGSPWEWPVCGEEGPCVFEFTGSVPSDTVYIWLRGCHASIDDLSVTLQGETPLTSESWGVIKCLYGGPPN